MLSRRAAHLDPKESGHGEGLVALAVTCLVGRGLGPAGAAWLIAGVLAVEAAERARTASPVLRLSVAGLYLLLGCPGLAARQLAALGVKQVMLDSMTGHWLLPALAQQAVGGGTAVHRDDAPHALERQGCGARGSGVPF